MHGRGSDDLDRVVSLVGHVHVLVPCAAEHTTREQVNREEGEFGLEWPEPLVTFALSCGSWSSPAVGSLHGLACNGTRVTMSC